MTQKYSNLTTKTFNSGEFQRLWYFKAKAIKYSKTKQTIFTFNSVYFYGRKTPATSSAQISFSFSHTNTHKHTLCNSRRSSDSLQPPQGNDLSPRMSLLNTICVQNVAQEATWFEAENVVSGWQPWRVMEAVFKSVSGVVVAPSCRSRWMRIGDSGDERQSRHCPPSAAWFSGRPRTERVWLRSHPEEILSSWKRQCDTGKNKYLQIKCLILLPMA